MNLPSTSFATSIPADELEIIARERGLTVEQALADDIPTHYAWVLWRRVHRPFRPMIKALEDRYIAEIGGT